MKTKSIAIGVIFVIVIAFFLLYFATPTNITQEQAIKIASETPEAKAILEKYPNTVEIKAEQWNPYIALIEPVIGPNGTASPPTFTPEQENYKEWRVEFDVPNQATSAIVYIYLNGTIKKINSTSSVKCLISKTC